MSEVAFNYAPPTEFGSRPGTDWVAWLPGSCQVSQLVLHPDRPPRHMSKQVKRLTPFTGKSKKRAERRNLRDSHIEEDKKQYSVSVLVMLV